MEVQALTIPMAELCETDGSKISTIVPIFDTRAFLGDVL
jgi:hypothetical protein